MIPPGSILHYNYSLSHVISIVVNFSNNLLEYAIIMGIHIKKICKEVRV